MDSCIYKHKKYELPLSKSVKESVIFVSRKLMKNDVMSVCKKWQKTLMEGNIKRIAKHSYW